jgi:L-threonylcarbamoyladenylate synthase
MAKLFTSLKSPKLIKMLNAGAIGVIPTDTVYGLVGKASKHRAIDRLYYVKERKHKAGTTIGASIGQFQALGFPYEPLAHANRYWPASLSVVIDATDVKDYLKAEREALPVRIPDSPLLLDLLTKTGPLMTTSANHPGEPTATSVRQAMAYFGDSVDFYVDVGELGERPPSTIIEISHRGKITVHREGAVKIPL